MGAPLTYEYTQRIFDTRRKSRDFKAYKTDTRLELGADGVFTFYHCGYNWERDPVTSQYKRTDKITKTPLVSINPDNVVTLLVGTTGWPSAGHMTIRNRLADITGFAFYSDTGRHKNKDTAVRIEGRYYTDSGWASQPWCAGGKSLPYVVGTQFKTISNGKNGGLTECLNPPKDIKRTVKQEAIQKVKAETASIRKLAMVMLRVGFEEHLARRIEHNWWISRPAGVKEIEEVNYAQPTADDALAVLWAGMAVAQRPDFHQYDETLKTWVQVTPESRLQTLRMRVLDNGMKALRKHIYKTTDGYNFTEAT